MQIKVLIPDLPSAESLLPALRKMDAARRYTNFGPLVQELEHLLALHWPPTSTGPDTELAALQVVTLNTGTAPLELGIAALGLPQGGEVLVPSFTFPASASAALRNGLRPVFSDVTTDTWQLSPAMARDIAAQRPLALVMPVATFGHPLEVAAWDDFVDDTGIPVLMDAAAAFGNQAIGRRAHASFSLHATKPFGVGEGGLFVTRDAALAERVRRLSNFGFENKLVTALGTNAKLPEYAAAVGLTQWTRWPHMQAKRQSQWEAYHAWLSALPDVRLQAGFESGVLPASVVVALPCKADAVRQILAQAGIESRRWYCPPLHQHPAYAGISSVGLSGSTDLPVTHDLACRGLGLPWHHLLTTEDFCLIQQTLMQALESAERTR